MNDCNACKDETIPHCQIIADDMEQGLILPTCDEIRELNLQTAYNKTALQAAEECGCFHCGRRFSASQVDTWISELLGEDTGICPCCSTDALVIGTERVPLSTSMLTSLYLKWFQDEYAKKEIDAVFIPFFSGRKEYLAKGIPFLIEHSAKEVEFLQEIKMWSAWQGEYKSFSPIDENGSWKDDAATEEQNMNEDGSPGGTGYLRAYFGEDGYRAELSVEGGQLIKLDPWTGKHQSLLLEYTAKYGRSLRGIIKGPDNEKLQVFVALN